VAKHRPTVIRFEAATVVRAGNRIVDHVTWEVHEGDRWVVLGPNGAGKTTLMELAATRILPTRGTVEVLGERVPAADATELRSRIGVVSPHLGNELPADLSVLDAVRTSGYGVTRRVDGQDFDDVDDERAMDMLDAFAARHLAYRPYGSLSEGERKRVQLARAVMPDPELLLLDEPAAGLDLGAREELVGVLSDVASDPNAPATVLVTHHVEEVPVGFTHALLLREGLAVGNGRIRDVLTDLGVSACFGVRVAIDMEGGRYAARLRRRRR
jgi:iron complex transport system ATP-binding protein